MKKLTDKQQAFIDEYLIDLNATQAAIRAGYSEKTAQEQSSRLLSNVKVQNAIQKAQQKRREANAVTRESLSAEIDELIAVAKENAAQGNTATLTPWVKALEVKAKMYGLSAPVAQIDIQSTEPQITKITRVIVDPQNMEERTL